MKKVILLMAVLLLSIAANAQIGYQVTLLDRATGEPRSVETVAVVVEITNSAGTVIYSGTQTATTNDFGILSLSIGDSSTFDNMDWSNLPLYVSAAVDGILIGRSQILNVPVAEYAKRTGVLTPEILCSQTWDYGSYYVTFSLSGTFFMKEEMHDALTGPYYIVGDMVLLFHKYEGIGNFSDDYYSFMYVPAINKLFPLSGY